MILVFDLDDTLVHSEHEWEEGHPGCVCKATLEVLDYCKQKNHILAMASFNHKAMTIAKRIGIYDYFDIILGECCCTKLPMIDEILEKLNAKLGKNYWTDPVITKSDVIFFDDFKPNIFEMRAYGITSVHINEKTGVTMNDVRNALP